MVIISGVPIFRIFTVGIPTLVHKTRYLLCGAILIPFRAELIHILILQSLTGVMHVVYGKII